MNNDHVVKDIGILFIVVLAVALIIGITLIVININHERDRFIESYENPTYKQISNDVVYKEASLIYGIKVFKVYDEFHQEYIVSEYQYDSYPVPIQLNESLYLLPDGSYVVALVK